MRDGLGSHFPAHLHQGAQGHHSAIWFANIKAADVCGIVPLSLLSLEIHPVYTAEFIEIIDVQGTEIGLQGIKDVGDRESQVPGFGAVQVHIELGHVHAKPAEQTHEIRGLIPFLDMEKYHKNIATKMFDYMAAGLAVVASDLPPQRQVVEGAGCGTLIEPEDSNAFVIVIKDLLADPEQAYLMGKNGWTAIQDQYCWEEEEKKLFALYNELMK